MGDWVRVCATSELLPGEKAVAWDGGTAILVFKPRLVRALPIDVGQYAAGHAAFPQETTADQFFTEEQWESYRKLGQTIADSLRGLPGLPAATPQEAQALLARMRHLLGDIAVTLMRDPRAELRDTRVLQQAMDRAANALA